ncbi:hypothetical protein PhCBS80983_g02155 [Powellomyces hirtus]|uniref:N-alpha-acetyltransferase 40 n=1 Tax=Powellomyces hirtus TaxID=109895 RepID=A0A507E7X2_9FUNG|nr:hypothetical protein PhCBS80983_g02155 [Powellomyces hirtus]
MSPTDVELVAAANSTPLGSLLENCQTGLSPTISSTLYNLQTLPSETLDWALDLVKRNLYEQYAAAKDTGWSSKDKLAEMTEENALYVVATEQRPGGPAEKVGFLYFQFTMEDSCDDEGDPESSDQESEDRQAPVIYCYELQLETGYQRRGFGTYFMDMLEELGSKYRMRKSMLTVFKSNTAAIAFYQKRGLDRWNITEQPSTAEACRAGLV